MPSDKSPPDVSHECLEMLDSASRPFLKRHAGHPTKQFPRFGDVQTYPIDLPRSLRNVFGLEPLNSETMPHFSKYLVITRWHTVANIEDFPSPTFECQEICLRHVLDVDVVTQLATVAVYNRLSASQHLFTKNRKNPRLAFRALPRAINVAIAQHDVGQPIECRECEQV